MKFSLFLLSLTIFAGAQALPANAQEAGGAQEGMSRWQYKPNVWGSKPKSKPQTQVYVPHSVRPGTMPHSSAFLDGLSPSQLRPTPPTPQVQQQVQAIVSVPHTQAAPFRNDFGAPVSEHIAQSKPMTESSMPAAKLMSPAQVASSGEVTGHLRHNPHVNARHGIAASLPQIQGYGGQGYSPGVFDPGSGTTHSTKTAVNGVIVHRGH
jgi:hypothetical protein